MRRSQTHWPSRLVAHNTFTKSDPAKIIAASQASTLMNSLMSSKRHRTKV